MLKRRGTAVAVDSGQLAAAFREHMKDVIGWLESRAEIPVCRVGYRKLLADPTTWADTVRGFLGLNLDIEAMALQVDPSLYRNRRP